MSEIVTRHLNAIAASMALLNAQLEALRFAVLPPPPTTPTGKIPLPARCAGCAADQCALQGGEWSSRASFADSTLVKCLGCGFERSGGGLGE